jgi:hypothetical protein
MEGGPGLIGQLTDAPASKPDSLATTSDGLRSGQRGLLFGADTRT